MNITPVSPLQKSVETKRPSFLNKISPDIAVMLLHFLPLRDMYRFALVERSVSRCWNGGRISLIFQQRLESFRATSYTDFKHSLRLELSTSIRHLSLPSLGRSVPASNLQEMLTKCSQLEFLNVSYSNHVQDSSLSHAPPSLRAINFERSNIADGDLVSLKNLPSLEFVDFSRVSNISGAAFNHLPLSIKALKLYSHTTDADLALLARFPLLEFLDLSDCRDITGKGLAKLPTTIKTLTANSTDLEDTDLAALSHLTSLETIDLSFNWSIHGSGLIDLPKSVRSIVLDYSPSITDLSGLPPQLRTLSVQRCGLTDDVARSINTSSVKFINFSENHKVSKEFLSSLPKTIKVRNEGWADLFEYRWFQYDRKNDEHYPS